MARRDERDRPRNPAHSDAFLLDLPRYRSSRSHLVGLADGLYGLMLKLSSERGTRQEA